MCARPEESRVRAREADATKFFLLRLLGLFAGVDGADEEEVEAASRKKLPLVRASAVGETPRDSSSALFWFSHRFDKVDVGVLVERGNELERLNTYTHPHTRARKHTLTHTHLSLTHMLTVEMPVPPEELPHPREP
jgi:hypothetical protein